MRFVNQCNQLPKMIIYSSIYKTVNHGILNVLNNLSNNDPIYQEIIEMINGDSIKEAADILGIKSNSVYDIFKRLLKMSFEPYISALTVINAVNRLRKLPFFDQTIDQRILESLKNGGDIRITQRNHEVDKILDELESDAKKKIEKEGRLVERLLRSQTECQTCKAIIFQEDEPIDECIKGIIITPRRGWDVL